MRKTYWFVALGAVALGLSVLPWSSERAQSQESASIDGAAVRQALDEIRKDLAAERAERKRALGALEAQLLELASDVPTGFTEVVAPGETGELDEPSAERAPQLPHLKPGQVDPRQKVEHAFVDEPVDGAWAQSTERNLRGVLAQQLKVGSLRSLSCRKTMCRLETTLSDAQDYWRFMSEAVKSPETRIWAGDVYAPQPVEAPGTGEVTLVSYLVRDGERMPSPY